MDLTLDEETVTSHFLGLGQAHSLENRRCDITQNAVCLLQAPALGGVGHDEGDLVGCVRSLWLAVCELHFFGVAGCLSVMAQ